MKNITIIEVKRAIINKRFILLIILGIIAHIYSLFVWDHGYVFFDYKATDINVEAAKIGVTNAINRYTFWYHSMDVYVVIMPLLACLPYSTSFMEDKKSSFINYITTRVKKKDYLISKIFSNALAGGLVLSIPTTIFYLILTISVKGSITEFNSHPIGFMSNIFMTNPNKYIIYTIIIEFLFGVTYATFGLAVSNYTENMAIIILTPLIYWYIATYIFETMHLIIISPAIFNGFMVRRDSNIYSILSQVIVILVISIFITKKKSREVNL